MGTSEQATTSPAVSWEAAAHWWCERCGIHQPVDETDHCRECAYMRGAARRGGRGGGRHPR